MYALARPAIGAAAAAKVVLIAITTFGASVVLRGLIDIRLLLPHVPMEFWVLAGLAVVADVRPFSLPSRARRTTAVLLSICFTFAIMLLWGIGAAIVVQTFSLACGALRQRLSLAWALFTASRFGLALVAANTVLNLFGPPAFGLGHRLSRVDVLAVIAAGAAWFLVNYALMVIEIRLRHGTAWRHTLPRTFGHTLVSTGALLLLSPVLVSAPTAWVILLILAPVIAVSQMARLSGEQQEQIRVDQLTGLLSRRALAAEVDDLMAEAERHRRSKANRFAMFLLDLDGFKNVNDALGHAVGDRLLADVGRRLAATVRPGDLVARLGGDEFAVVAVRVADVEQARTLALRITQELMQPAYLDDLPLDVSASIGVAVYPLHGDDFATLMQHADVAMYEAKRRGGAVAVYNAQSDHHSAERLSLLSDLRRALENPEHTDEIAIYYQPQVTLKTGDVVGVEALLRWNHPGQGLINSEELLRAAEQSAVMHLLTSRIVDDVVTQVARWNSAGLRLEAAINVSVRDLHTADVVDHLRDRLQREGVKAEQIKIEITETALMPDPRRVLATVRQLTDLGVGLSLDDFGTGYSSLLHLRHLPVTEVKIDRSFVQTMADDPHDEAIVRSIIELSRGLGLRVVAEGVEHEAVSRMLAAAGCDTAQGWYYGAPMPAADLASWLTRQSQPAEAGASPDIEARLSRRGLGGDR
jgi:diguanylate cyclase (GGDEF)-like protein